MPLAPPQRIKLSAQEAQEEKRKNVEQNLIRDNLMRIAGNKSASFKWIGVGEPREYTDGTIQPFSEPQLKGRTLKEGGGGRHPWTILVSIRRDENDKAMYQIDPTLPPAITSTIDPAPDLQEWKDEVAKTRTQITELQKDKIDLQNKIVDLEAKLNNGNQTTNKN